MARLWKAIDVFLRTDHNADYRKHLTQATTLANALEAVRSPLVDRVRLGRMASASCPHQTDAGCLLGATYDSSGFDGR